MPGSTIGAALLDEVRDVLQKYVVLPSDAAYDSVVLWSVATHGIDHFEHATRLCVHSPEKRCGKSRLLEVVEALSWSPLATTNASVPALFRLIEDGGERPPTLILDEADRILGTKKSDEDNRDLINLLNNGWRPGKPTRRCVGPQQTPTEFRNFAMAAVAGIGRLPDTIEDRGINITMQRRGPGQTVAKFRLRTDLPKVQELRGRISEWVADNQDALDRVPADLPDGLEDRAEDAWEPLITLADAAGGRWPAAARRAAVQITSEQADADDDTSLNVRLLSDIQEVFTRLGDPEIVRSQDLCDELRSLPEAPWDDFGLTPNKIKWRLRDFKITTARDSARTFRGYRPGDFHDAFARYTRQNPSEPGQRLQSQASEPDGFETTGRVTRPQKLNPSGLDHCNSSDVTGSAGFGRVPRHCRACGDIPDDQIGLGSTGFCLTCEQKRKSA